MRTRLQVESSCATSRRVSASAAEEPLPIKCDASVLELVPCSDSLSGKRAVARPDHRCCVALKELMLTPECLCFAASTAHGFNKKQVLSLPSACNIRIKPGQTCDGKVFSQHVVPQPPANTFCMHIHCCVLSWLL